MNTKPQSTDAFLAYPDDVQGNEYIVTAYNSLSVAAVNQGAAGSQILIAGIEDGTQVFITPPASVLSSLSRPVNNIPTAGTHMVTLKALDTYLVETAGVDYADLSGTIIRSTKPISVTSGATCANVPYSIQTCDHLVEAMNPVSTWDKVYAVSPAATRTGGDVVRVMGSVDGTVVTISCTGVADNVQTINRAAFYEFELLSTGGCVISADNAVSVMQFFKSYLADTPSNNNADPSMIAIPGVSQWDSRYGMHFLSVVSLV
jgi:hypothetical protein